MAQGIFDDIPPIRRPAPVERPGSARRRPEPSDQGFSTQAPEDMEPSRVGRFAAPMLQSPAEQAPGFFDDIPVNVSTVEDVAKSAGSGLVKGGVGLVALPGTVEQLGRMGVNYVGDKLTGNPQTVSPETVLPGYAGTKKAVEDNITGPLYKPKTTAGEYASTIAEFAPGMLFPAGAGAGLAARAGLNVVAPAVASETAGQLTKGTSYEPYARVAGGLAGGMLPSMAGRAFSPGAADPKRQRMAAVMDKEGIALTAGDRSGRKQIRYAESVAQDTPFGGQRLANIKEQQAELFTRAALRRAGIQADRVMPEVMDDAFKRIGGEFQAVAKTAIAPITPDLQQKLNQAVRTYERVTEQMFINPLPRAIVDEVQEIVSKAAQTRSPAALDGARYLALRSDIGDAARGAASPRSERVLYEIQHLLDNAAESFLKMTNPQMVPRMREARRQYRNILVLEKAAAAPGENAAAGLISTAALASAVKQLHGARNYVSGKGDFAELARAGEALLKPLPNSGTQPRLMVSGIGAGIGGALAGAPGAISGAHVAPAIGQALQARLTGRPGVQAYLGNQVAAPIANLPTGSRIAAAPGTTANSSESQAPLRGVSIPMNPEERRRALAQQLMRR